MIVNVPLNAIGEWGATRRVGKNKRARERERAREEEQQREPELFPPSIPHENPAHLTHTRTHRDETYRHIIHRTRFVLAFVILRTVNDERTRRPRGRNLILCFLYAAESRFYGWTTVPKGSEVGETEGEVGRKVKEHEICHDKQRQTSNDDFSV